jgi:CBS domain containing-hemolysin-like protein
MVWEHVPLLVVYVAGALSVSFVCSILEATLLSARVPELLERRQRGDRGAALLLELKHERIDDAISAILTLNTIAHTIGAALAGAQAARAWGDAAVGIFSGVLTLLVLVLTEIIPKTVGTAHSSRLVGVVARITNLLTKVLAPVLFLTRALTRLLTSKEPVHAVSARELAALVTLGSEQGTLSLDLSRALGNLLRFDEIRVSDIMTPRTVSFMMPAEATIADLLAETERSFSRVPLFEETPDNVVGYVLVREPIGDVARGLSPPTTPLRKYLRPARHVLERMPLGELLRGFLSARDPIAIAVDEFGGVAGLVTLEDALETILGQEIQDELDNVADLRQLAIGLRARRLERVQPKVEGAVSPPPASTP